MKDTINAVVVIALLPLTIPCALFGFVVRMLAGGCVAGWRYGEKLSEWVES